MPTMLVMMAASWWAWKRAAIRASMSASCRSRSSTVCGESRDQSRGGCLAGDLDGWLAAAAVAAAVGESAGVRTFCAAQPPLRARRGPSVG